MKIAIVSLFSLLAFSALGQTPPPPNSPPTISATPAPVSAPAAATIAPVAPAVPSVPPIPSATASPGTSVTLTVTSSATPSADDEIDNAIEKKIRRHFDFSTSRHSHSGDSDDDSIWIALPIVFIVFFSIFGMPVLIVGLILFFSFSRNRSMHKTVRMMVEKGQPVPESLLNPPPVVRQRSDLRRAIKWMLWGVGIVIFLGACNDWDGGAWSLGIIPFMVGLGYLIFWRLDLRHQPPSPPV